MKRWNITMEDGYIIKMFYNTKEEAEKHNPKSVVSESEDYDYLEYIDKIKEITNDKLMDYKGGEILKINVPNGIAYVRLYFEDIYLDGLQYQIWGNNRLNNPITWNISTPEIFYNTYLTNKEIEYHIYNFRKYGQPKLAKPKELKGIKQCFSVFYLGNRSKCQCFIRDNDLYIKHVDYFSESLKESPELFGTPLEYRCRVLNISNKNNKFIYPDCWGDIVLRNEAWVVLRNIIPQVKLKNEQELIREVTRKFADCKHHRMLWTDIGSTWTIFWNNIIHNLYQYLLK